MGGLVRPRCALHVAWAWVVAGAASAAAGAGASESCASDHQAALAPTSLLQRGELERQTRRLLSESEADRTAGGQPAAPVAPVAGKPRELELAEQVTNGLYEDGRVRQQWARYQAEVVEKLLPTLTKEERAPMRILLATYVGNSLDVRNNWAENVATLRGNLMSDTFDFAFFHYDGDNSLYAGEDWYMHPSVKVRHVGVGCPSMFWRMLDVPMVQQYDYVWLTDGDMHLGFFSWDVYRIVLARLQPMVSQPTIVPIGLFRRASDIMQLNMRPLLSSGELVIARESNRSEVMTPVLSTRVWPALHQRLSRNNLHTMFYSDSFWDMFAAASQQACGRSGVVLVDASPSRHMDWRALLSTDGQSAHCTGVEGSLDNNKAVQMDEMQLVAEGLRGHCDKAGELLLSRFQGVEPMIIQYQLALDLQPRMRQWTLSALSAR